MWSYDILNAMQRNETNFKNSAYDENEPDFLCTKVTNWAVSK